MDPTHNTLPLSPSSLFPNRCSLTDFLNLFGKQDVDGGVVSGAGWVYRPHTGHPKDICSLHHPEKKTDFSSI
ncbi:hypothetical protein Hanom_Chr08g00743651 [Helianthus anomalus]